MIPALVSAAPTHHAAEQIAPVTCRAIRIASARCEGARRALHTTVGCALFALIANAWLVQGLTTPTTVASGSMAPALLGPHRVWHCSACGHDFRCSAESLPAPEAMAACSNCGARHAAEQGVDCEGDRVLVDRATLLWRAPRRWETVVFRDPRQATAWCVKRVVGLPGETVEIRGGDLVVDGRVAARDLSEVRAMAINVYDAHSDDRRWRIGAGSRWKRGAAKTLYRRAASQEGKIDWLTYRHENDFHSTGSSLTEAAILDESPVDQAESRALEPVTDFLLDCQLRASGAGEVLLRAGSTDDEVTASLDVNSGHGRLVHNSGKPVSFTAGQNPLRAATRVELILADRRARLILDGRPVAELYYEPSTGHGKNVVAIGGRGAAVEIRRLQILRDIHYTAGPPGGGSKHRLGPNEYYVLGDNSPHALDSRAESFGKISGGAIVGRAIPWPVPRKGATAQESGVSL